MERLDLREKDGLREIKLTRNFVIHAEGSVLIEIGNTKIICNATVEDCVPGFLKGKGSGWITAEYAMLPRATATRNSRDIKKLRENPRAVEIQRLIGRALRAAVDMDKLGERSILIDCDVIQADGGTRTAAISGGFVAMYDAIQNLIHQGVIQENPVKNIISAVSVGIVKGIPLLDLCYVEDAAADVDLNVIMTDEDKFVEIQGTGEKNTFDMDVLNILLNYARKGNAEIIRAQKKILGI